MFIAAQIMGIMAFILNSIAVQKNKKSKILILKVLAGFGYMLQYIFLGAWAGIVPNVLGMTRNIVVYKAEQKSERSPYWILIVFLAFSVTFGAIAYDSVYSLIPIATAVFGTYVYWQKSTRIMRIYELITTLFFIIYNLHVLAYVSAVTCVLYAVSAIIAIIRLDIVKKEKYPLSPV